MRADLYIQKLVDFANNIEQYAAEATIESIEVAKKELESAFDKGVNIEGKSFEGGEWWSDEYKKTKTPYTSKRGRSFKFYYPALEGHYKKLDLTGDFREGITFEKNLFEVEAKSTVSYSQKIVNNIAKAGINIFSFKNSKETRMEILKNLLKKYRNGK